MYLTLSIRCILPHHPQKNCLLKIHNRELDLHIQVQNNFIHKYQYIYRLWPCQLGSTSTLRLELQEKGEGQGMKLRGTAQAKIKCASQGEMYRFHGNRSEGQVFLMRFWAEKVGQEGGLSQQEAELRQMNNQMQQNLLKYREELQNYQEFLYFTNNVIRELNNDSPEVQPSKTPIQTKHKDQFPTHSPRLMNTQVIDRQPEQPRTPLTTTKRRYEIPEAFQQESERNEVTDQAAQTSDPSKSQARSQVLSENSARKSSEGNDNCLSKYRYLEDMRRSKVESSKFKSGVTSRASQGTAKMAPKNQVAETIPEIINKKRQMEITNRIKQRRQQYFNLEQLRQVDESQQQNMSQNNRETPIHKLSSCQVSKKLKESANSKREIIHESHIEKMQDPSVMVANNQKNSTRSQTGLKDMLYQRKLSNYDHAIEAREPSYIQNSPSNPSKYERSQVKSVQRISPSQIVKTVAAPIQRCIEQDPVIQEQEEEKNQVVHNIARRRKAIAKNSVSIIGDTQQMHRSIHSSRHEDLAGSIVSKLCIFNLKTTFYANFRSNVKKCIIEHGGQVYQTAQQKNNLKQTFWDDRIVISGLKPAQDLVFMIYAIRMDQLQLEGTAIIHIRQILSSPERHFKFYLYFENIAVGCLEFDIGREKTAHRRLTVSLPEIKAKSPPKQEIGPNTIRVKTISQQSSRMWPHPSQRRQAYKTAEFRQSSLNSESEGSAILPSNNEITKKVRSIKMNKFSRLGKVK